MRQMHTVLGARHPLYSSDITAILPLPWVPWDLSIRAPGWGRRALPQFSVPSASQGRGQRKWSLQRSKGEIIQARNRLRCWGKWVLQADLNVNISFDPGCELPVLGQQPLAQVEPHSGPSPRGWSGITGMHALAAFQLHPDSMVGRFTVSQKF